MNYKYIPKLLVVCGALIALALSAPQAVWACGGGVICVDTDATGDATGLSWTDAYTNVQDALAVVAPGNEIWVAEGVYYPDEGAGQTEDAPASTFTLQQDVEIYGGFAATETLRAQRNPAAHITVLSGDIDRNDVTDGYGVVTDVDDITGANAYHVLTGGGVDATARLDGFIVTAGSAEGEDPHGYGGGMINDSSSPTLNAILFSGNYADYGGGGMYNLSSNPTLTDITFDSGQTDYGDGGGMVNEQSSPTLSHVVFNNNQTPGNGGGMVNIAGSAPALTHVTFNDNFAVNYGGGMYNLSSSPALTNTTFHNNTSDDGGGGMVNEQSSPTLINVTFSHNLTNGNWGGGGGMYNIQNSHPTLTDVAFIENQSLWTGGGMYNEDNSNPILTNVVFSGNEGDPGGGMYNLGSSPALTNVLFSGNRAGIGSGMYNGNSDPTLVNVTFGGNWAEYDGGGMFNESSSPVLRNCILWGDADGGDNMPIYNDANSEPDVTYSLVQWPGGVYTGTGNLNLDPRFVAPVAAAAAPTTAGDYRLGNNSPAIDAGAPETCPATDLRGELRNDRRCDIGAYEYTLADGDTVSKSGFAAATPYSFGPTLISVTLAAADSGSITATKHLAYPGGLPPDAGEVGVTWWISNNLSTGFLLTLDACYTDAEVAGLNEGSLELFRWAGGVWVGQNAAPDANRNCVRLPGVTGFSAWTLKDTSAGAATPAAVGLRSVGVRSYAGWSLLALLGIVLIARQRR